jgi:phage terminase large subunit-like protein
VAVKLLGAQLREKVLSILESYPEISVIMIEGNQGQELWREVFHNMPVRIVIFSNSEPKEVRAGRVHALYQRIPSRVVHTQRLQQAEEQMVGFPRMAHDDIVDAIGSPVLKFLKPAKVQRRVARTSSYA